MNWRTEWKAISDRIQGLLDAGNMFSNLQGMDHGDPANVVDQQLVPQAREIFGIIETYCSNHKASLPLHAASCLDRFITSSKAHFLPKGGLRGRGRWQYCFTAIASFRAEFTYHLSDRSAVARRLSERAFLHLQRSIVADSAIRERWGDAFGSGEVACEKLGGAHLLSHGIWAFKVVGEGERTDLVFGEPLRDLSEVEATSEALVLTEWKIVRDQSELEAKARAARLQAGRYKVGILGGLELAGYVYPVLVSWDRLGKIPDVQEGDILYRHINIAVDPRTPSRG